MDQNEVSRRIEAIMARKSGAVDPDTVTQGTEVQRRAVGGRNLDGTIDANVPSAMSAADELASRSARTMHGPESVTIHMPDHSTMPKNDGSAILVGGLVVFPSHDGGFYSKEHIAAIDAEGKRIDDPDAVIRSIYDELRAGGAIAMLPKQGGK